ncbi:MAG: FAD-binding oxidoreductase [Rhodobacteraceae bacterium]|nr:FAD-binding oxidoreductase [Paracoccaceae bacterium]
MALNLLDANDAPGRYPDSWYAATAVTLAPFAPLQGETRADVCVVGGGYTGLSAALHLAEAGRRVVLLEAHRVGFGASGRNGGQLGSGQRKDQIALEALVGAQDAARLWQMGEDSKALVRALVERHGIDCALKSGIAWAGSTRGDVDDIHRYAEHLARRYGYDRIETLDAAGFAALCPSPDYKGGMLDMGAGHLHPLNFALGLARAAAAAGVQIHETSRVTSIAEGTQITVSTSSGSVRADNLILACNGYLGGLNGQVAARVMPINNFVAATEPLGARVGEVLRRDIAVSDARFVVNYFRLSADNRLLFGGGESYGYRFPRNLDAVVRKPMAQIFPHLRDIRFDHVWGGTLAITMKRMPYLARLAPNVLSASGYSGHGVGTATHAGQLMALAITGETDGFDTMARVPSSPFPGGPSMRTPLLILAMTWFALRDRLGL